ncbi:MAG: molybdopterin cofactor-binding domain-containing protein, partial [Zestosphaera sp.]
SRRTKWADVVEQSFWLGVPLQEFGYYRAPRALWDEETGQGAPYITYTFGAIIADVEVDIETGLVRVNKIYTAYDIGKVINKMGAELNAEGGAIQALGYALMEELIHDKEGRVSNPNLSTYYIPTIKDVPEIIPIWVEAKYKKGPLGAKGFGEPSFNAVAAAIANAVAHAIKANVTELPVTPERVYTILKSKQKI